jgi:hypothetical protein
MLANLIYLARLAEADGAQRNGHVDPAGKIVEEMAHHPMLCE